MILLDYLQTAIQLALRMSTLGLKKGPHFTRYYMYEHLSQYKASRSEDLRVLSVSGSKKLGELLGFSEDQIVDVQYPEHNIVNLPFSDGEFDAVVSDQVLEHVEGSPQAAIDETFRVIKPGGLALHTTCFMHPIHGAPNDFWRFTPYALRQLSQKHGHIIDCGGWGNPYVLTCLAVGAQWVRVPHARWHPLHWLATRNSDDWPIVTWILAKKRSV